MKTLMLLRHAKATRDPPNQRDQDRHLTARGQEFAAHTGRHLARMPPAGLVMVSPSVRTRETWDIVATAGAAVQNVIYDQSLYLCGVAMLVERICATSDDIDRLMIVGHNPELHDTTRFLCQGGGGSVAVPLRFPTSALAVITLAITRWSEAGRQGAGRLDAFLVPGDKHPTS